MSNLDLPPTSSSHGVTPAAHDELTDFLQKSLKAKPPIKLFQVSEGSNRKTHLVAVDSADACFGLKAVSVHKSRVTDELFTADHILLIGELSQLLKAPVPIKCIRVPEIPVRRPHWTMLCLPLRSHSWIVGLPTWTPTGSGSYASLAKHGLVGAMKTILSLEPADFESEWADALAERYASTEGPRVEYVRTPGSTPS